MLLPRGRLWAHCTGDLLGSKRFHSPYSPRCIALGLRPSWSFFGVIEQRQSEGVDMWKKDLVSDWKVAKGSVQDPLFLINISHCTYTSPLTSPHSHTHQKLQSHKVFSCQLGHLFYWWFVIWNLKTHFRLVISLIPQPAYICLLIFFYHMIPLITPSIFNNFVILQPLVLFLVFLLSCFHHRLHSSTDISQVPSAHITFKRHASIVVLTKNSQRQVLWEIALVDTFSHALSPLCQSSTKGLG